MTLDQFLNCLDGHEKRIKSDTELADSLNHTLGSYILTAYHNPKKYPSEPSLSSAKPVKQYQSDEDYERYARMKYGKKK